MSNISNEEIEDQIRILEETSVPGESDAFALRALRELLAYRKASEQPVAYTDEEELRFPHGISDMWPIPLGFGHDIALFRAPPPQAVTVPDWWLWCRRK